MTRTQLNVSIDPELLKKIKESARISGKSLVSFVSDCFVNQIENVPVESIDSRFTLIERRLKSIEKKLNKLIEDIDGFKSMKIITKKQAEFTMEDGSIKTIDF